MVRNSGRIGLAATVIREIVDMRDGTKSRQVVGDTLRADPRDFSSNVDFSDHKIAFVTGFCNGKDVLDLGCVQHDPQNYQSKYWIHGALKRVSRSLLGLDLYEDGVRYLRERGFDILVGDAQAFDLGRRFDVIVAGDIIEHLEDFSGMIESCKRHLVPGGRLLISTPNPWYWRYVLKAALFDEVDNNPEHTCWLCPRTLRQLLSRHRMSVGKVVFGSRYRRDTLMPLPRGWKHTSFHAETFVDG